MSETPEPRGTIINSFDWDKGPQYGSPITASTPAVIPGTTSYIPADEPSAASQAAPSTNDDTEMALEGPEQPQEPRKLVMEVTLREGIFAGQVVRLKHTNAWHDTQVDMRMVEAGYPLAEAGLMIWIRCHALCAIRDRGNYQDKGEGVREFVATKTYQTPPRTAAMLNMLLQEFETPDVTRIQQVYSDLTGGGKDTKTF